MRVKIGIAMLVAMALVLLATSSSEAQAELPIRVREPRQVLPPALPDLGERLGLPRPPRLPRLPLAPTAAADEIIVKFAHDSERPFRVLKVGHGRVAERLGEYQGRSDVIFAEPNYLAHALYEPNDSYYYLQWHFDNDTYGGVQAEQAWDILGSPGSPGANVVVAVIDTGVAYENYWFYDQAPDLSETCFVPGYDFVGNDTHANDDAGHGTHVTGTIAQSTDNASGVAGLAFDTCIMPIKVLSSNGSGTYADIADAIYFAADNGADIINLSLGGPALAQVLEDALAYAYSKGVTIIAAAGNDGTSSLIYPAAYNDYAIAVGATRFDEQRAYYSNYGNSLDLVAPGGDVTVDQNGDGYGDGVLQQTLSGSNWWRQSFGYYFYQGTSMAAPHVAGVAALVIGHGVANTPDEVRSALETSADDLGAPGWDAMFGHGLVNAAAALQYSNKPDNNPPEPPVIDNPPAPEPPADNEPEPPAPEPEPEPEGPTMHIDYIDLTYRQRTRRGQPRCKVYAKVKVVDENDARLSRVDIDGTWSEAHERSVSGDTNSSGIEKFKTPYVNGCGSYTFTVDNLTKSGYTYDSSANTETSDTITIDP